MGARARHSVIVGLALSGALVLGGTVPALAGELPDDGLAVVAATGQNDAEPATVLGIPNLATEDQASGASAQLPSPASPGDAGSPVGAPAADDDAQPQEDTPALSDGGDSPAGEPQDEEPTDGNENPAPTDISSATVTVADQHWTGKALEPEVTVTLDGATLVAGIDYETAFADNVARGTATVTVTGSGSYAGTVTATFEIGAPDFADVTTSTAHANDIAWLSEEGVTRGWETSDGAREFRPNASIVRGDMAAFLYRLAGSPDYTAPADSPFTDVTTATSHYKEICWLAETGVSTGWSNGDGTYSFRSDSPIVRGDMAAFLYRLAGSPAVTGTSLGFSDVTASTSHWREILWMQEAGLARGWAASDGSREFRPNDQIARGDTAAFLHRQSAADEVAPGTDASARAMDGWVRNGGSWSYLRDGSPVTGLQAITSGGRTAHFAFDATGKMLAGGPRSTGGKTYLAGGEGALLSGWTVIDGRWHYFDSEDYSKQTTVGEGYTYYQGDLYYYDEDGLDSPVNQIGRLAQRVVDACKTTPSPGSGLCAAWVTYVFRNAGIGTFVGNANQMHDKWCDTTDTLALRPGMIVAVDTYPGGAAALRYGHVAIYVGNNTVWQNLGGHVGSQSLTDWANRFDAITTVRWGWLGDVDLS